MRRLTRLTLAAIVATAVTGCATMNVSSHVERGLDITKYRRYQRPLRTHCRQGIRGSTRIRSSRIMSRAPSRSRWPSEVLNG